MRKDLSMFFALDMGNIMGDNISYRKPLKKRELSPSEKKTREPKIAKSKGLIEFQYGVNSLWALNKDSADKKAKKKGWI